MNKKFFQVVCIDPPYKFSDSLSMSDVKRGASSNYPTLSFDELKSLPISDIVDPDGCILALWCPSSLIEQGLELMKAYGFRVKQTYVWVKIKKENKKRQYSRPQDELSFGMGRLFRGCHEICLIGTNNNKIYQKLKNRAQRSVSFAPNLKHSTKPENLQDSLDLMFSDSVNKIEIFARRIRNGWICIGNEVCNGEDIRVSLAKLKD